MNATIFPLELRIDAAGHFDHLVIAGADVNGEDLVIEVAPSEDQDDYDAALRAAGFEPVGDDQARRA